MSARTLADHGARLLAITALDRTMLVEAGAGSGKTAVMAGRIAYMLADGVEPSRIVAVTFTELAASELLTRVREYVDMLLAGDVPQELRAAFPGGLDGARTASLQRATATIDELTCSTIHGFCQRLITPYPVEARIDPGASVMDRGETDRLFDELFDAWVRERLSVEDGLLASLFARDPRKAEDCLKHFALAMRASPDLTAPTAPSASDAAKQFIDRVAQFQSFLDDAEASEPDTLAVAARFESMAAEIRAAAPADSTERLTALIVAEANEGLCTAAGEFRSYRQKGKWEGAAKAAGLSKADGGRLNDRATLAYAGCCEAWDELKAAAAARAVALLLDETRPLAARFAEEKRRTARLDFDDLIRSAALLLRTDEPVRKALGTRFRHVLVDEFQDTDPLQTEIFWRLCGEPTDANPSDWTRFSIRPGALFLVGDPKQAIYRFRGADVNAYLRARELLKTQDPNSVVQISTNFRSCRSILTYVNARFAELLSAPGQPGFAPLDHFQDDGEGPCVAALDVTVGAESGKPTSDQQRDAEAEAVAELCVRLIGSRLLLDRKSGGSRACRPGDIALLAPTGNDLWRYEEALERRGVPVSTQAGKGLFRRQEIQDLIAIARVLADSRDTLALGALLRGPLVGLTEEELLDVLWALPRDADADGLPRLGRWIDPSAVGHELARDVLSKLSSLARRANFTTPHDLLSQAVDAMRLRPVLLERHKGRAERALSNVDLFLELARPYAVRGLRAFAEAMSAAWSDGARAIEGRPDAQDEAVALYTMHAAKGLEWPIVVPINAMTRTVKPQPDLIDVRTNVFQCPVFGAKPTGYEAAQAAEREELDRERARLWYVAATRAKELLIVPRSDAKLDRSAWLALADLRPDDLPAVDVSHLPDGPPELRARGKNEQTREIFKDQALAISRRSRRLEWIAPSRAEGAEVPPESREEPAVVLETEAEDEAAPAWAPQGGRDRGRVIHKLFEEVLTGEIVDSLQALEARAADLIGEIGMKPDDAAKDAREMAESVRRALDHPVIAPLRPILVPEYPLYSASVDDALERVVVGVADAVAVRESKPNAIVDWKSDVHPDERAIAQYRSQVYAYLAAADLPLGLIVFVTTGQVVEVRRD